MLHAAVAAFAGVSFYAAGLVDNDLVDLERDCLERPERPLPSGAISPRTARVLRIALPLAALLIGASVRMPALWFAVAAALLAAILVYNRIKAVFPKTGFLAMGLCRGLNLLCGAALWGIGALKPGFAVWAAFAVWTLYVAGLTAYAARENERGAGGRRYFILATFLPGLLPLALRSLPGTGALRPEAIAAAALFVASCAGAVAAGLALRDCGPGAAPERARGTVGRLIRALFPIQALACLVSPAGAYCSAALLGAWLVAGRLSRRYAQS